LSVFISEDGALIQYISGLVVGMEVLLSELKRGSLELGVNIAVLFIIYFPHSAQHVARVRRLEFKILSFVHWESNRPWVSKFWLLTFFPAFNNYTRL